MFLGPSPRQRRSPLRCLRSRSPDPRGHDAHCSTGGPPASSFSISTHTCLISWQTPSTTCFNQTSRARPCTKKVVSTCLATACQHFDRSQLDGPRSTPPTWAKPWCSLGHALGGTLSLFFGRSRPPDPRGHDAHRSTGGPPASSFFACILESANWLEHGHGKKQIVGWMPRQMQFHGYKMLQIHRRLDVQTNAVAWLHSTTKRATHMVM